MARRKTSTTPQPKPYVKSPLQLEQWAAYQALTAKREAEAKANAELSNADAVVAGQAAALHGSFTRWQQSQNIRSYIAATMALLPSDASQPAVDAANRWREWALNIADAHDSTMAQVNSFLTVEKESPH